MNVGLVLVSVFGGSLAAWGALVLLEDHNVRREMKVPPPRQWTNDSGVRFTVYDQEKDRVLAHNLRDEDRLREDCEIRMLDRWWNVPYLGPEVD